MAIFIIYNWRRNLEPTMYILSLILNDMSFKHIAKIDRQWCIILTIIGKCSPFPGWFLTCIIKIHGFNECFYWIFSSAIVLCVIIEFYCHAFLNVCFMAHVHVLPWIGPSTHLLDGSPPMSLHHCKPHHHSGHLFVKYSPYKKRCLKPITFFFCHTF